MACPPRYFNLLRNMKRRILNQQRICPVDYPRQHGIKATQNTVPTMRKWLRRSHQAGPSRLMARSPARHR
jgi:hypothetical protein